MRFLFFLIYASSADGAYFLTQFLIVSATGILPMRNDKTAVTKKDLIYTNTLETSGTGFKICERIYFCPKITLKPSSSQVRYAGILILTESLQKNNNLFYKKSRPESYSKGGI